MTIQQLSILLENKPGCLCEVTDVLANSGVNIRALSLADTTDFGILRIIVDKPDVARAALRENGCTVSLTEVLAIGVEDKPGGLTKVLHFLQQAGVDVDYMYAFLSEKGHIIFRVEDNEAAMRVLRENGVSALDPKEMDTV